MAGKKSDKAKQGKVLPPEEEKLSGDIHITQAVITHLSERPDLMIDALENHDKGFVKRMIKRAEEREERLYLSRFHFSRFQAYTSLSITAIAALCCPFVIVYLAVTGKTLGLLLFIGSAIFFAVARSGPAGFARIVKGIERWLTRGRSNNNDE